MAGRGKPTQVERLVRYLRSNPGASGLELVTNLAMPKYTSRISDARDQGYVIDCAKDRDGVNRYTIRDATPGVAYITNADSKAQIERKIAEAFSPVDNIMKAWREVFGGDA